MLDLSHLIRQMADGVSYRKIAKNLSHSKTTVAEYAKLFKSSGIPFEQLRSMSHSELADFISSLPVSENNRQRELSDFLKEYDFQLLSKKLTRLELYEIYSKKSSHTLCYSQFCTLISARLKTQDVHMHLEHEPGDKLFIDFAGDRLYYIDSDGKKIFTEVFLSVLGHSQFAYVEAVASQKIADFLPAIENSLRFYGGVPRAIVPDNLKSAVTKGSRYEAVMNESFRNFCEHFNTYPFPARPYQPRDKSLVENAVAKAYQYIYKTVRQREYHSLAELNSAILVELEKFNYRNFSQRDYSRKDLFERNEKEHLQPLIAEKYEILRFAKATVRQDHHVLLPEDKHYYSVPFELTGKTVKITYNNDTVEIFNNYKRVATHLRNRKTFGYTTTLSHRPPDHQYVLDNSKENLLKRAILVGEQTAQVITAILNQPHYEEQRIKSCKGILSIAGKLGKEDMELCCKRALTFGALNYQQILNIANKKLYRENNPAEQNSKLKTEHANQRGGNYYNSGTLKLSESVPLSSECCTT